MEIGIIFGFREKRLDMVTKGRKEMERFDTNAFMKIFLEDFFDNKKIW